MAFTWVLSRHSGAGLRRQAGLNVKIPNQVKFLTSTTQLIRVPRMPKERPVL